MLTNQFAYFFLVATLSSILLISSLSINPLPQSNAQVYEYVDQSGEFSLTVPPDWEIIPKPDNLSDTSLPAEEEFPYYGQNTAVALKLKGISELDFDKHTYITITVRGLEEYTSTIDSDINIQSLDDVVNDKIRQLETGLSERIFYDILSQNSNITLGGEPAYQIHYILTLVPIDYYNVYTITIHENNLYNVYFNTGELMATQTLDDLNNILKSFRFLT